MRGMIFQGRVTSPLHAAVPARRALWPHLFMAAYGLGWALAVDVGVRLYFAEVVAFVGLAILNWSPLLRRYPIVTSVLGAYGLWVVAIVISDLVNATAVFDTLRNLATPIFGAAGLVFVACCIARAPGSLLTYFFVVGTAKGIFGEPLYGDAFSDWETSWASVQQNTNFFKVRFEPVITPLSVGLAILLSRRSHFFAGIWLLGISLVYFLLDTRSSGLMFFIAGLVTIFFYRGRRFNGKNLFLGTIVGLLLGYGAYAGYVYYSLNSESPGHNALQLQYTQNPYNPISLLLIGRSEWLVLPEVIAEKPIFGWGSWARDYNNRFAYLRAERIGTTNLGQIDHAAQDLYLPAHSVVGAAWAWSGILGFVAMVWLAALIFRLVPTIFGMRDMLLPAVAYLTTFMLWHFLFSPPQSVRLHFPVALGTLVVLGSKIIAERRNASLVASRHPVTATISDVGARLVSRRSAVASTAPKRQ